MKITGFYFYYVTFKFSINVFFSCLGVAPGYSLKTVVSRRRTLEQEV